MRAPEALGEYAWGRLGEKLGEDMERRLQLMDRVFGPRRPG